MPGKEKTTRPQPADKPAVVTAGENACHHIHLAGLVQGVGFRPFVWQLATAMGLQGWVNNSTDGVHIEINAPVAKANLFYQQLISSPPPLSVIRQHNMHQVRLQHFEGFTIKESSDAAAATLMLTPDYALCARCRNELHDAANRRFHYPFITCTQCGPRYSILQTLPYDRVNTSMQPFTMCAACDLEYNHPADKRYYSQTNSCWNCGITMQLFNGDGKELSTARDHIIHQAIKHIADGKIIAVKGIGGYLLLCDAANKATIRLLRQRKHRSSKPFAVMYPGISQVEKDFILGDDAKQLLQSPIAPIVLLRLKENSSQKICTGEIAPGLSKLGVMLPYAPLFELIVSGFNQPVIATSGNISEAAIVFDDEIAKKELLLIADVILSHNRAIVVPQDDSVMQVSSQTNTTIIHRRSRGMAPSFFAYRGNPSTVVLSTGALLKSSFCLVQQGNVYISQYLGNTDNYEAQLSYETTLQHYFKLFNTTPAVVIADKHQGYFTRHLAEKMSIEKNIPLITVQHHKAHFAAVLAENNLLNTDQPVMGVIWDGVGAGDDGQVWGGEFFRYANNTMERCGYLDYFPVIAGDKMAREPRLSALAVCHKAGMPGELLKDKFTSQEWVIYQKLLQRGGLLNCSSMGRLFDAVACLLSLAETQAYEGEAAMLLEEKAAQYFDRNGWQFSESYFSDKVNYNSIPVAAIINGVVADIKHGLPPDFIAAKFHWSLVHITGIIAGKSKVKMIACSGGVFQNAVLVDLFHIHHGKQFRLFFHKDLSPNDENIAFGQMVYYDQGIDGITHDT